MTFPKARLAVSALLLIGWLGFLLYLVIESRTITLSKPQFLDPRVKLYVVIELREEAGRPDPEVKVDEVLWSATPADAQLVKKELRLKDLPELGKAHGYLGPGKYLAPLIKSAPRTFLIAPLPRTAALPDVRIYPWTPD